MYIDKLHINTFAGLDERTIELKPGLNIIEGGNESGKSTIVAFIKFMFYGANAKEREAFASWRSGGAAGTLTFTATSTDGSPKKWRIERALVSSTSEGGKLSWREMVQLVDLDTGMPCHKGECPGELFFGVDATLFESTAYVSQLGGAEPDHSKASEGIENLLFSADESVDTARAAARLDAARVAILHKNEKGGRLYELENQIAELETRLESALKISSEIRTKQAQLADLHTSEAAATAKSERLFAKCRQFEVRTLVGLFERMHAAEAKYEALKKSLGVVGDELPSELADGEAEMSTTDSSSTDSSTKNSSSSHRALAERIRQLDSQLHELELRRVQVPGTSEQLSRFERLGGREGVSDLIDSKRGRAGVFRLLGIISLILALVGAAGVLLPSLAQYKPIAAAVLGAFAVAAVIMLILSAKTRRESDHISSEYDLDALEAELTERETAREAVKLAELSLVDLKRRREAAISEAEALVGKQSDVGSLLAELELICRNRETQSGELLRYRSLVESMHAQLAGRDEDELRAQIDESDISDVDMSNLSALRREADFEARKAQSQAKFAVELEKALAGLNPLAEDASKLSDRLGAAKAERDKLAARLAALKLASAKLAEASEKLRSSVAPRLASDASRLLSAITDGKYGELGVGASLEASIATEYGQKSAVYLSAGTRDAVYLALRIALCRLVFRKESSPLICDESFSRLDDRRAARMLALLGEADRGQGVSGQAALAQQAALVQALPLQVLVTTSTRREATLANGANVIRL